MVEIAAGVDVEAKTRVMHHSEDGTRPASLGAQPVDMGREGVSPVGGQWTTVGFQQHQVRAVAVSIRYENVARQLEDARQITRIRQIGVDDCDPSDVTERQERFGHRGVQAPSGDPAHVDTETTGPCLDVIVLAHDTHPMNRHRLDRVAGEDLSEPTPTHTVETIGEPLFRGLEGAHRHEHIDGRHPGQARSGRNDRCGPWLTGLDCRGGGHRSGRGAVARRGDTPGNDPAARRLEGAPVVRGGGGPLARPRS